MRRKRRRPKKPKEFPRRWKISIVIAACGVVCLGGLAYGGHGLRKWVSSQEAFRVNSVLLEYSPESIPAAVTAELKEVSSRQGGTSMFDPSLLVTMKRGYEESGWVKEVTWVRKSFPDTVECRLQLREPCGAVLSKSYYLTDFDGIRLPGEYREWPCEGFDVPMITGTRGVIPSVGTKWNDDSVKAAVEVLKEFAGLEVAKALKIKSIDVSNLGGKVNRSASEIVLRTGDGTEIWWGRRPGSTRMGERSSSAKVGELNEIVQEDSIEKYRYIDLRFEPAVKMLR